LACGAGKRSQFLFWQLWGDAAMDINCEPVHFSLGLTAISVEEKKKKKKGTQRASANSARSDGPGWWGAARVLAVALIGPQ